MDDHKSSIVEHDRSLKVSGESEVTMPEQLVRVAPDVPAHVWPGVVAALAVEETRLMIAVRGIRNAYGTSYANAAWRTIRDALGITGARYRQITGDEGVDTEDEDEECDYAGSCCGYCVECEEHHGNERENVCSMGLCHECDHHCDDH